MTTPRPGEGPVPAVPSPPPTPARERTAQSRAVPGGHPTIPRHGVAAYRSGCRCGICRAAKAAEARHYRRLYREAVGGPSSHPLPRRWALTDKGLAAINAPQPDHVDVPVLTPAALQLVADENRGRR